MLARGDGINGEIVLRRRSGDDGDVYELIVNGVFLMDTAETSTEQLLADAVLQRHPSPSHVLLGGMGLGFTAAAVLEDARVSRLSVVEIEPLLVSWLRNGLVPEVKPVFDDDRLDMVVDDVGIAVDMAPAGAYDAILLDVDNGPDFLVHPANAGLYGRSFLESSRRALADGGKLAVWLAAPAVSLAKAITSCFGNVEHIAKTVQREGRDVDYHVYLSTRTSC